MKNQVSTIRTLLLIIVIPLVLYLLKLLSFIFIPLTFGVFGALLFSPLMRWFQEKRVPRFIGIITVIIIVAIGLAGTYEIVNLAQNELETADADFKENFQERFEEVTHTAGDMIGIKIEELQTEMFSFLKSDKVLTTIYGKIRGGINIALNFITMLLMSLFFMLLLLAGSLNVQKILEILVFKDKEKADRAFREIEKSTLVFVLVKVSLNLLTGFAFGITCYFFDVSFPTFWGLLIFVLSFIQVIGPVVGIGALSIFGLIELGFTGSLVFFALILIGIEVLMGGVIEPIFMGKSFSINTITILVMLAIWGVIWGIPGMILAVPITFFLKIMLDSSTRTKLYSQILS